MDSKQRLIMLVASGVLLLGAAGYVVWHHSTKQEDPSAELTTGDTQVNRIAQVQHATTVTNNKQSPPAEATKNADVDKEKEKAAAPEMPRSSAINTTIAAINRETAKKEAKETAGRQDPMMQISGYLPYPGIKNHKGTKTTTASNLPWQKPDNKIPKLAPPPPPDTPRLVPPPPPASAFPQQDSMANLPISTLPNPPSRPTLADKMKLICVLDDKAILAFKNAAYQSRNKWPKTLTLGPGDQFESVSVISVDRDSVTLQEDGERSVKTLERVH